MALLILHCGIFISVINIFISIDLFHRYLPPIILYCFLYFYIYLTCPRCSSRQFPTPGNTCLYTLSLPFTIHSISYHVFIKTFNDYCIYYIHYLFFLYSLRTDMPIYICTPLMIPHSFLWPVFFNFLIMFSLIFHLKHLSSLQLQTVSYPHKYPPIYTIIDL